MRLQVQHAFCVVFLALGGSLYGCAAGDPDGEWEDEAAGEEEAVGEAEDALCTGASDATTALDAEEQAFLTLINNHRAANGKAALTSCKSLSRASQGHSESMRNNNFFSHTGLNGSTPWARACNACYTPGCGPTTAMAENIAAGNSTAANTFNQWKNSPGHNTNMLNSSYTRIGIGRATGGGTYGSYWTTVFGGANHSSCTW